MSGLDRDAGLNIAYIMHSKATRFTSQNLFHVCKNEASLASVESKVLLTMLKMLYVAHAHMTQGLYLKEFSELSFKSSSNTSAHSAQTRLESDFHDMD